MKEKNIILIITDQQRFDSIRSNGCEEAITPNIDNLAKTGINFKNHYVNNPVCSPSRASMFTGKLPSEHGLWANGCTLPRENMTIPEVLKSNGYQTAHFGKLHLEGILDRKKPHYEYGFESCMVAEGDIACHVDEYNDWMKEEHPDIFESLVNETKTFTAQISACSEELHHSRWVTNRACQWIDNATDEEKPFFLSIGYFDPHPVFNPCQEYAELFDKIDVKNYEKNIDDMKTNPKHYLKRYEQFAKITEDDFEMKNIIRAYYAMVSHIDSCVGEVINELKNKKLNRDTVVIFTSDHGELLGNNSLLFKGPFMLDDLLKVPLIINDLSSHSSGEELYDLTSGVDIMPTVLSIAGIDIPSIASGLPLISKTNTFFPKGKHEFVLAEWEDDDIDKASNKGTKCYSLRTIITKDYQLTEYNGLEEGELHKKNNNSYDIKNLYSDPLYNDIKEELRNMLSLAYLSKRARVKRKALW